MSDRRITARRLRVEAAELAMIRSQPEQLGNGEENLYPGRIASYSKGLPHDERGLVEPEAYAMLRRALASRSPADFERIPMGTGGSRKLANPQAGLAQDYAGADRDALTVGSELDKLASNISLGRNAAGVHWRSDYTESGKLGEAVAIGLLQEQSKLYNEPHSLTLTRFDGRSLEVSGGP